MGPWLGGNHLGLPNMGMHVFLAQKPDWG